MTLVMKTKINNEKRLGSERTEEVWYLLFACISFFSFLRLNHVCNCRKRDFDLDLKKQTIWVLEIGFRGNFGMNKVFRFSEQI
jgi:hypothetical protein